MDAMSEHWKPVVGWEASYSVSSLGRVRRDAAFRTSTGNGIKTNRIGKMVNGEVNQYGYRRITLCDGSRRGRYWAHRLVAAAFLGPAPTPKHRVNHRNGRKLDNRPNNLEWVTVAENNRHSRYVLGNDLKGDNHPRCVLSDATAKKIYRDVKAAKWSMEVIAARYNTDKSRVSGIARGKDRKHLGLVPITGHRRRKLSIHSVPKIRAAYARGDSLDTLAARYKVNRATIYDVVNGRRWSSVQ